MSIVDFQINFDTKDFSIESKFDVLPVKWQVSVYGVKGIICFNNLEILLTVLDSSQKIIFEKNYPSHDDGQVYESADQGVLETASLPLEADQTYTIKTKVAESGNTYISEKEIVAPRPEKPYESWIWNGEEYVAPKQMPKDRKDYYWDESIRSWVVEPDYEVE